MQRLNPSLHTPKLKSKKSLHKVYKERPEENNFIRQFFFPLKITMTYWQSQLSNIPVSHLLLEKGNNGRLTGEITLATSRLLRNLVIKSRGNQGTHKWLNRLTENLPCRAQKSYSALRRWNTLLLLKRGLGTATFLQRSKGEKGVTSQWGSLTSTTSAR